jgi:malate dehydrogenase (oxaloacetate-decarboxylating)
VEAADVAMQAIKDGVARKQMTWDEAFQIAKKDIDYSRSMAKSLHDNGFIADPPVEMLEEALNWTIKQIGK